MNEQFLKMKNIIDIIVVIVEYVIIAVIDINGIDDVVEDVTIVVIDVIDIDAIVE